MTWQRPEYLQVWVAMWSEARYDDPPRMGALSDTAICPSAPLSVCLSHGAAALGAQLPYAMGTLAARQLNHRRSSEMCGLRTRPRTDVDPPRVELPLVEGISSRRPRGDKLLTFESRFVVWYLDSKVRVNASSVGHITNVPIGAISLKAVVAVEKIRRNLNYSILARWINTSDDRLVFNISTGLCRDCCDISLNCQQVSGHY